MQLTREAALEILNELIDNDNLRKHMLAVEAACRFYARKYGEDEEIWGVAGLLHDADYEKYPEQHPQVIVDRLREINVDPAIPQAIACHGTVFGIAQESLLDKVLFACDELTGLITATALVRPDKSLAEVEVKSVKKKLKDRTFAKGVDREDIRIGVEQLGIPLDDHIANVLQAMQDIAPELGL